MSTKRTKKKASDKPQQKSGNRMVERPRWIIETVLLVIYLGVDLLEIWPNYPGFAILIAILFFVVIAFVELQRRHAILLGAVLVVSGLFIYRAFPQVLVSVSPDSVFVGSSEWSAVNDVTLSNRTDDVLYNSDFNAQPSSKAIEYTVDLVSVGSGSIVVPAKLGFTDGSITWPVSQIAPKSTIVFRVKSRLKERGPQSKIMFSASPALSKPRTTVVTHP